MSWWTCVKGAAQYLAGTRAEEPTVAARAQRCGGCPNLRRFREDELRGTCAAMVRAFAPEVVPVTGWCGVPGKDAGADGCGCLVLGQAGIGEVAHVYLTIGGGSVAIRGVGKLVCKEQVCPRGDW